MGWGVVYEEKLGEKNVKKFYHKGAYIHKAIKMIIRGTLKNMHIVHIFFIKVKMRNRDCLEIDGTRKWQRYS